MLPATSMRSRVWAAFSHIISSGPDAPLVVPDGLGSDALDLLGAVGEVEHAALVEARFDAFGARDAADLVDRLEHRALHVDGALAAVFLAMVSSDAGKNGDTQPPLRPEAPKPAISFSTSTMRSAGSALAR